VVADHPRMMRSIFVLCGSRCFLLNDKPSVVTSWRAVGAQVQLLGQPISVGRPSGYVDPSAAQAAALKAAEALDRCVGLMLSHPC